MSEPRRYRFRGWTNRWLAGKTHDGPPLKTAVPAFRLGVRDFCRGFYAPPQGTLRHPYHWGWRMAEDVRWRQRRRDKTAIRRASTRSRWSDAQKDGASAWATGQRRPPAGSAPWFRREWRKGWKAARQKYFEASLPAKVAT